MKLNIELDENILAKNAIEYLHKSISAIENDYQLKIDIRETVRAAWVKKMNDRVNVIFSDDLKMQQYIDEAVSKEVSRRIAKMTRS